MNTDEKTNVRLALFGPGGFGGERARAMTANPRIDFAACYSPFRAEMLACQAQFGARPAETEADIWDDQKIDGVVLSTPNQLHLEHTRRAASAGKHVFVEKPIAATMEDAFEMVEVCRRAGVILMVGHNDRRRQRIRAMRKFLDEGRLGRPLAAEANNSLPGGLTIPPGDWRWKRENAPGGGLCQLGIHKADTLQYLLGPVARVCGWQRRLAVAAEIEDAAVTLLEFESGVLGYLGAHYAVQAIRFVHVLGTEANVRWDHATGLIFETAAGRDVIPVEDNDTVQEEIDEFAACILTGATPEVGGEDAIRALAVVHAALLSNERGRPVEISELLS